MDNIVIQVPSKSDLKLLLTLVSKLGFKSFFVTEKEANFLARQKLSAIISEVSNDEEPTLEELNDIVDQVRSDRYAQNR